MGFENIVSVLNQRAEEMPTEKAYQHIASDGRVVQSICYRELNDRVIKLARFLSEKFNGSDRIIIMCDMSIDYITCILASMFAGLIPVTAYPPKNNHHLTRLSAILEDAKPSALILNKRYQSKLHFLQSLKVIGFSFNQVAVFNVEDDINRALEEKESKSIRCTSAMNIVKNDIAFLQYTSGSTSKPKGVVIKHKNLIANLIEMQDKFELDSTSIMVTWLPPYHDMGLILGLFQPMFTGFPCIFMLSTVFISKPMIWLETISKYRATISGGPNFAFQHCIDQIKLKDCSKLDLQSWKIAFNGAESVLENTLTQFAKKFSRYGFNKNALYPCYGLAEATLMVTGSQIEKSYVSKCVDAKALKSLSLQTSKNKTETTVCLISSGKIINKHEIVIVDVKNPQNKVENNQLGEICIHGPSVSEGYWSGTDELFAPNWIVHDNNKFFCTQDLGFLDENENLYVLGRKTDVFNLRGCNYFPQDIEYVLAQNVEYLRSNSCAAFAIEENQKQELVIVVEIKHQLRRKPLEPIFDAIKMCIQQTFSISVDAIILLLPGKLYKTSSGKLQRTLIKSHYLDNTLEIFSSQKYMNNFNSINDNDSSSSIENFIQSQLRVLNNLSVGFKFDKQKSLYELGMDSVRLAMLINATNDRFNVEVEPEHIMDHSTCIKSLAKDVARLQYTRPVAEMAD